MNLLGSQLSNIDGVTAMTDVTGFGLLGHLAEICEGSNLNAEVDFANIKTLDGVYDYIEHKPPAVCSSPSTQIRKKRFLPLPKTRVLSCILSVNSLNDKLHRNLLW